MPNTKESYNTWEEMDFQNYELNNVYKFYSTPYIFSNKFSNTNFSSQLYKELHNKKDKFSIIFQIYYLSIRQRILFQNAQIL